MIPREDHPTASKNKEEALNNRDVARKERRKEERYVFKDRAWALMRQPENKIGQIIDISMSGLAFSYLSIDSSNDNNKKSVYMDLLAEEGLLVESLPAFPVSKKIISDKQSINQLNLWRQSVKFGNLSEYQKHLLKTIIKQYKKDDK